MKKHKKIFDYIIITGDVC